tara:strand:- start:1349 stop:2017 length:669 start_codon:yes stop_codon:yes gene_type:complete
MATLNSTRDGYITGQSNATFSTARTTVGTGSATESSSSSSYIAIQFFDGRGANRFTRLFAHFDTSGISGSVSDVTLTIYGGSATSTADIIVLKSTAFNEDGGTALATSDFFDEIDYSTEYSAEYSTTWVTSANVIPLISAAQTDIQNDNNFTVAIVNHDADYSNTDLGSTESNTVDFSQHFVLTYTEATAGYTHTVNGVAAASIATVKGVATANIETVIGVD